ncbi:Hypothetical_protein [Hexamita inflata]|uniref:Hypothetical_protein n=1 Tax=Hexamita inflata TaxID=28002 RepID=A0AA86PQE8_9EUKA|nr:Hypothetical protein HINF_LOCUS30041 [Hexamita inflata]CAI9942397.1 Hypothetical protein HINF_LOCUS30042 [Hexamita inflata]
MSYITSTETKSRRKLCFLTCVYQKFIGCLCKSVSLNITTTDNLTHLCQVKRLLCQIYFELRSFYHEIYCYLKIHFVYCKFDIIRHSLKRGRLSLKMHASNVFDIYFNMLASSKIYKMIQYLKSFNNQTYQISFVYQLVKIIQNSYLFASTIPHAQPSTAVSSDIRKTVLKKSIYVLYIQFEIYNVVHQDNDIIHRLFLDWHTNLQISRIIG